jgi:homeobox protein cut-like
LQESLQAENQFRSDCARLNEANNTLQKLVQQLEDDLSRKGNNNNSNHKVNSSTSNKRFSEVGNVTTHLEPDNSNSTDSNNTTSGPTSTSTTTTTNNNNTPTNSTLSSTAQPQNAQLLAIVSSQRDRFRQRIVELEEETKLLLMRVGNTQTEADNLRNDNIKLFEKIRFLQSYSTTSSQTGKKWADLEAQPHSDGVEEKYAKLYEETVNPFVLFNRKEQSRRYKDLNTAEKVVLSSGRFFLSTKYSRTFLFFYSLFLHLLVFMTLYRSASIGAGTTT